MVDKVAKLLAKLPPKELDRIKAIIIKVVSGQLEGLDIKALKGSKGVYRVRAGNYRVIFRLHSGKEPEIIVISKRDEKTYKDY